MTDHSITPLEITESQYDAFLASEYVLVTHHSRDGRVYKGTVDHCGTYDECREEAEHIERKWYIVPTGIKMSWSIIPTKDIMPPDDEKNPESQP